MVASDAEENFTLSNGEKAPPKLTSVLRLLTEFISPKHKSTYLKHSFFHTLAIFYKIVKKEVSSPFNNGC